jgi:putative membrane protein
MHHRANKRTQPVQWLKAIPRRRYLVTLAITFSLFWLLLAIAPFDRGTWALENSLAILFLVLLAGFRRRLFLSRVSYTLIFLFLCVHSIGAHYTYARVPYDEIFRNLSGLELNRLLGWERNNYDRAVHFLYGLLLAYPVREVFLRVALARGFWGYFLPLDLTMSTSMLFELLEWATAIVFGAGATDYLGTQGDPWDAHKDMALASLGALLAMSVTALLNRHFQRDFNREWIESLRVKNSQPLGEEEAARMLAKRTRSVPR